ncbi:methyl-CpG-binding domain-containing protein 10-like [Camellia sinensis]|uniref:methyl-CpG-binding domain-containing protein 10-like n=1 Tax=Camellia sinensis TaxID=4442 RepID=UPI001035708E|nr:methyl-CpG-binding domain-containing protein 10-like [Camellia sinensis]
MTEMKKEFSALQKTNKGLQLKMKNLEDQAEAATKAQQIAEEKAESVEAIRKVAEAEKIEVEDRKAQAEKELQEALATKDAETKEADEKAYAQGMANVTEEYKLQVRQVCNRGFSLGWMSLIKKLDLPADSPFRNADAIPLPFPPPPPSSQPEGESESEVTKEATSEQGSSDVPQVNKSIDETFAEIDAEIAADKEAKVSLQETSEVQIQPDADAQKS